jgi:hypothetical protein
MINRESATTFIKFLNYHGILNLQGLINLGCLRP